MDSRSGNKGRNWKIDTLYGTDDLRVHIVLFGMGIASGIGVTVIGIITEQFDLPIIGGSIAFVSLTMMFAVYGQYREINPKQDRA